ncbi:hypothetical protein QIJ94_gp2 [ssRNA phage SRR5466337_2]|uniref:Uncharacterized protein n=1 Tax=ssRNA phage SRR5466337_2 TaxID=2786388 RepID=A0A8S5L001_9VIRU|nr:hypothetical protein QIJ94_gp2 [ssRNA phage SRR5466337_2]DAD50780.1 TPA_asm: hypothetical protein [ssRNA phage SRR5466337_2]
MLTSQLFVIPVFIVGRRMTLTIEIRARSCSGLPLTGDHLVVDFDDSRDRESYEGLPKLCFDATVKLRESLRKLEIRGWPLSVSQKNFVAKKAPEIEWLYDMGYGERASVPQIFFECLLALSENS